MLSAVLECVEVGAGVVLDVVGLVFGLSSRYCGGCQGHPDYEAAVLAILSKLCFACSQ